MTATRGTTNRNDRGSSEARRRRREWLVETFRADRDMLQVTRYWVDDAQPDVFYPEHVPATAAEIAGYARERCGGQLRAPTEAVIVPACRCYRCGKLLTVQTVTVDRIIPGAKGGTYRRNNIRPACSLCNSETGGQLRWSIARAKVLMRTGAVPR